MGSEDNLPFCCFVSPREKSSTLSHSSCGTSPLNVEQISGQEDTRNMTPRTMVNMSRNGEPPETETSEKMGGKLRQKRTIGWNSGT
ncbi:hypothetical protein DSL72_004857 [Monilinia vaccinii-corymbosi]|uniref:Uncharacterized protein n=1 Tax=Monilinia vaccinii-corymbosi TaxID=61207 RepID=A0A8A3NXD9_9HELO|nr:hypothetical protein DSL72_004857 [Monilinia vaccinii-corymbosi]